MVEENYKNTILKEIVGDRGHEEKQAYSKSYLEEKIRPLAEVEKDAIQQAISLCDGNVPKAAVFLNVAPSTIYRKLKQWEKTLAKQGGDD